MLQWENKPLPFKTAALASVAPLPSQKEENIGESLPDKKVFLIVDEAEVNKQPYIYVLMSSFDTPNETILSECFPLENSSNVKSSIILLIVDDVLR